MYLSTVCKYAVSSQKIMVRIEGALEDSVSSKDLCCITVKHILLEMLLEKVSIRYDLTVIVISYTLV